MYPNPYQPVQQVDPAVLQWFTQVDKDRSGHISAGELQQALALGNLNFSVALCAQMIRLHDKTGTGQLDLQQFASLHFFLVRMQQLFVSRDTDRSGRLSAPELQQALSAAGYQLDPPVFDRVGKTFDPNKTNSWGLAEFLALIVFLESAKSTFKAFDPQNAGRINLDFQQFLYASAHVR